MFVETKHTGMVSMEYKIMTFLMLLQDYTQKYYL